MNGNLPRIINVVLLIVLFAASASVWGDLPARIPIHYGLSGEPDRWADTSFWSWFGLPLIVLGLTIFLTALGRLVMRHPALLNIPDKKKFLALPRERQEEIIVTVQVLFDRLTLCATAMFCTIQYEIYRTAHGASSSGMVVVVFLTMALMLGLSIVSVVQIQKRINAITHAQGAG